MRVKMGPYPMGNKKRRIKVRIDPYDVWGLDHTLALIIAPALKMLKEKKHGAPIVDDEDVPEGLRRTAAPPVENAWDTDANFFKRWDWVLDQMIWAFEQQCDVDHDERFFDGVYDKEAHVAHEGQISEGLRLFAKYYRHLWD